MIATDEQAMKMVHAVSKREHVQLKALYWNLRYFLSPPDAWALLLKTVETSLEKGKFNEVNG